MNQKKRKTPSSDRAVIKLKKQLSAQAEEMAVLRSENAKLKRKVSELQNTSSGHSTEFSIGKKSISSEKSETYGLFRLNTVNSRRFSKQTYFRYLVQTVKDSTIGIIFQRISLFFRRFRLIRRIAYILSAILLTLLVSAVFITVLPFLIVLTLATLLTMILKARTVNSRMREALHKKKRIRMMILSDRFVFGEGTFTERCAISMSQETDTAVLVITPKQWSTKGLGGKGMFFTVREEKSDLFLVRRSYFFILRRRVIDRLDCDITVIY